MTPDCERIQTKMSRLPFWLSERKDITIEKIFSVHYFEYASNFSFEGESHDFWEFICVDKGIVDRCMYLAKVKGYKMNSRGIGMPSTDATSFVLNKIPAISFGTKAVMNGPTIHSRRDTINHLDPDRLIELCEFLPCYTDEIINAEFNVVPRELPKEVTEHDERWRISLGLK
mgnify:CR=1 FL=1